MLTSLQKRLEAWRLRPRRPTAFAPPVAGRFTDGDFRDYFGASHAHRIVRHGNRHYVATRIEPGGIAFERLGSALGQGIANVVEALVVGRRGAPDGVELVRVVQEMRRDELTLTDLTDAVAAEIVFSAFVNRRDSHNSNRIYVGGIPAFFDFDVAFGTQPGEGSDAFFQPRPDSGAPVNGRLWVVPRGSLLTTDFMRDLERGRALAVHPVHDVDAFWERVRTWTRRVVSIGDATIAETVAANVPRRNANAITAFLIARRCDLTQRIDRLKRTLVPITL